VYIPPSVTSQNSALCHIVYLCGSYDDHKFLIFPSASLTNLCNGPDCVLCEVKLSFIQVRLTKYVRRGFIIVSSKICINIRPWARNGSEGHRSTFVFGVWVGFQRFKCCDMGLTLNTYPTLKYATSTTAMYSY